MLKYFTAFNQSELNKFKIYILDSSENESKDHELKTLISEIAEKYIKYDQSIFVVQKIAGCLKYLQSGYSILLADDDLIDLKRYINYCKFLNENENYSCVTGISTHDNFKHDLYFRNLDQIIKKNSIEDKFYKDRVIKYTSQKDVGNPFYGVIRTELFVKIWSLMSSFVKFWYYPEIIYNISILLDGKLKVQDSLAGIRNYNTSLFNDYSSLSIFNYERNQKSVLLFSEIKSDIDKEFLLDQLDELKASLSEKIRKFPYPDTKYLLAKIIFSFIDKRYYYQKVDSQSYKFYKNVNIFYKENKLDSREINVSRKSYKRWIY